jgi:hypothetical protein
VRLLECSLPVITCGLACPQGFKTITALSGWVIEQMRFRHQPGEVGESQRSKAQTRPSQEQKMARAAHDLDFDQGSLPTDHESTGTVSQELQRYADPSGVESANGRQLQTGGDGSVERDRPSTGQGLVPARHGSRQGIGARQSLLGWIRGADASANSKDRGETTARDQKAQGTRC